LNTCGFCIRLPRTLPATPKINSYLYVLWDEPNSNEPVGWYLAKIISLESDRSICLRYRKGNLTEVIKLTDLKWKPARGTDKWFRPTNDITGGSSASCSKPHKVKGFIDDILLSSLPSQPTMLKS
jgi:hypothetical protein